MAKKFENIVSGKRLYALKKEEKDFKSAVTLVDTSADHDIVINKEFCWVISVIVNQLINPVTYIGCVYYIANCILTLGLIITSQPHHVLCCWFLHIHISVHFCLAIFWMEALYIIEKLQIHCHYILQDTLSTKRPTIDSVCTQRPCETQQTIAKWMWFRCGDIPDSVL